jgi:hypothetical protein
MHWAMPVYMFTLLSLCSAPTALLDTVQWIRRNSFNRSTQGMQAKKDALTEQEITREKQTEEKDSVLGREKDITILVHCVGLCLTAVIMWRGALTHPFLLADNR